MSEQFWVTGADGHEYGPVALEDLTRWIAERRVVATTQVRTGTSGWAEARLRPEIAAFFGTAGGTGAPPPGVPPPPAGGPPQAGGQPGGPAAGSAVPAGATRTPWPPGVPTEFRVWDFISRGWEMVTPHWLPLAAMFFIQFAIGCAWYVGGCIQLIIGGAILVGIWRAVLGLVAGRPPSVGMMFEGFDRFGDAFLAFLVMLVLTSIGFMALIIPGIILTIMWIFTFAVLAETRLGFWEAMRQSAILTEGYRWRLFLLGLACLPILLLGLLVVGVGVFLALPVCYAAFALAYRFLGARRGWVPAA